MALNIGELVGYLSVDDSKFHSGLKKAEQGITNLGTEGAKKGSKAGAMIGGAIAAGMLFALAKVKTFAYGAVDAFAAVEDAGAAAETIFGSAAEGVVKFADDAAKGFGLSKRAALEAQNNFAMLGTSAGLSGEDLGVFAQKLTGLGGDMSSFYGGTAEEAVQAVGSALRGEYESIRRYNVLLNDATLRQKAMDMGLISSVKDALTPAQKVMASYAAIVEKTTYLQGDFAKYSGYTANVQKTLAVETENAQVVLGQKLAPAVTAVRTKMLQLIRGFSGAIDAVIAMNTWMTKHSSLMDAVTIAIGLTTVAVVVHSIAMAAANGTLKKWIAQLLIVRTATKLYTVAKWLLTIATVAWNAITRISIVGTTLLRLMMLRTAIAAGIMTAAQWALNIALNANPIGLVVLGVGLLIGAFLLLRPHFNTIKNAAITAFNWIMKGVQYLVNAVIWGVNLMIKAWNLLPWHKDIKTLTYKEFPQLATAAETAAKRVDAALRKSRGNATTKAVHGSNPMGIALPYNPTGPKTPGVPKGFDLSGITGGVGGDDKDGKKTESKLDKQRAVVKKTYTSMRKVIASYIADKEGLTKDAAARELAADTRFKDQSFQLNRSYTNNKFKLDRSYTERKLDLKEANEEALADAQKTFDKSEEADKKKHKANLDEIEKDYQAKITQLNKDAKEKREANEKDHQAKITQLTKDAVDKRQSIVEKSIDLLTNAFASATSVDVGKMFDAESGVGGLLTSLKDKLLGAKNLAKNAAALVAKGFSQTFIQQVVSQGPEAGNAMSTAILAATPEAAGELKNLFNEIQTVSDTGVTALATSMNSGMSLATKALMDEYVEVSVTLQTALSDAHASLTEANAKVDAELTASLAQSFTALTEANARENANFDASIAQAQETLDSARLSAAATLAKGLLDAEEDYNTALFDMDADLKEALADADKELKDSLLESAKQFDEAVKDLNTSTQTRLAELMASLREAAKEIAALGGKSAGIVAGAPKLDTGLVTSKPQGILAPTKGATLTSSGAPTVSIGQMSVQGYTAAEIVTKFGGELKWQMVGR